MKKIKKLNIALVHLRANGDVLYATSIAKQIKEIDFPDSYLTWIVSSSCKAILKNNPYIDQIIEIEIFPEESIFDSWQRVKKDLLIKKKDGIYDEIFFTQIHPDNWYRFDGTVRASIFNNYPFKIKTSINPVVILDDNEISNVKLFANNNNLDNYNNVILFECSPNSNQSFINIELALNISKEVLIDNPNTCIILSSPHCINTDDIRIIDASKLSFRENAELTKYCTLLIGCSSGITWLSTSTAAKRLPMLQLLGIDEKNIFASVEYDLKHFKQNTDNIVEITNQNVSYIVRCITSILTQGIKQSKYEFGEKLKPKPNFYFDTTFYQLIKEKNILKLITFLVIYTKNNNFFYVFLRIFKIIFKSAQSKIIRLF